MTKIFTQGFYTQLNKPSRKDQGNTKLSDTKLKRLCVAHPLLGRLPKDLLWLYSGVSRDTRAKKGDLEQGKAGEGRGGRAT